MLIIRNTLKERIFEDCNQIKFQSDLTIILSKSKYLITVLDQSTWSEVPIRSSRSEVPIRGPIRGPDQRGPDQRSRSEVLIRGPDQRYRSEIPIGGHDQSYRSEVPIRGPNQISLSEVPIRGPNQRSRS